MATILVTIQLNGHLTDPDTVELASVGDGFGVRSLSTYVVDVASGTAMTRTSQGTYTHTWSASGGSATIYEYSLKLVVGDKTYYLIGQTRAAGNANVLVTIPSLEHYTSQAEVYRMIGNYAVDMMMDDLIADQGETWEDMLTDADETIAMYVNQHYDPNILFTNKWIRRRATILVANIISQRRGNPALYVGRTERAYEELNEIRGGKFHIPGVVTRGYLGPVVRNYIMQNRFRTHPVRVEQSKSTGPSYRGEDLSIRPFFILYG